MANLPRKVSPVTWKKMQYDFGAVADGITDDSSALQAAVDWLEDNQGGRVEAEPGTYRIASAVLANLTGTNNVDWEIIGHGSRTVFYVDLTVTTDHAFTVNHSGSDNVLTVLRRITFLGKHSGMGVQGADVSCSTAVRLMGTPHSKLLLDECNFYLIGARKSPVWADSGRLHMRNCKTVACAAELASGIVKYYGVMAHGSGAYEVLIEGCTGNDVGNFAGMSMGGTFGGSWLSVEELIDISYPGGTLDNDSGLYITGRSHFDEAPLYVALTNNNGLNYKTRQVVVEHSRLHVSSVSGGAGVFCDHVNNVIMRNNWIGYAVHQADVAQLFTVESFLAQNNYHEQAQPSASTYRAYNTCGTVKVIDCGPAVEFAASGGSSQTANGTDAAVTIWDTDGVVSKAVTGGAFAAIY